MVNKIEQDHQRFRQIIRGKIRKDLRRFIARGEMIGKEGKRYVSIPVNDIDIPTFRYGDNSGGVGMGDGEEGDSVGKGGKPKAGVHALGARGRTEQQRPCRNHHAGRPATASWPRPAPA